MDAIDRLKILSTDSQYDLSCSCGTSKNPREHRQRRQDGSWLYPVSLPSGGKGLILKTLASNVCSSDCAYCPLRHGTDAVRRCSLSSDEIANLFLEQNRRTPLIGLFLSSGIVGTADRTMQKLIDTASILRKKHHYRGYLHLKIIPGASEAAIEEALRLSSHVSLNIEVPGEKYFQTVSRYKRFTEDIIRPIQYIAEHSGKHTDHPRVKWSSQFIVGATSESDAEIVRYMGAMYDRLHLSRLFFSAYQPPPDAVFRLDDGNQNRRADREHRLYQTDWLVRKYGFKADELLFDPNGFLDLSQDPKQVWANAHPEFFPVCLNTANRNTLLRVPGIGPTAADAIIRRRAIHRLGCWTDVPLAGTLAARAYRYCIFS